MNWKDIPRIFKGVFTTKNISDDEMKIGVFFMSFIVVVCILLILLA